MFPILWLLLWLAGLQVQQAPRPGAGPSPASIQGVVVRAGAAAAGATQELADARVELNPGNRSLFTGTDGAFTFRNLAPGRYIISVTHDGFTAQEDGLRGLTPTGLSVTLVAGQTLKDIVLPMISVPVITGKVFGPHGEPLAAALVRAYLRQYTPYGTQLKIVKKGMTNDMGEFRLFGLNFGEYFVSAGYGDRDRVAALGRAQLSANVSRADDGYATIFYDGAEDISRAQAARLAPGSGNGTLNIYLRESTRFKIRGQVLPPAPGTQIILAPKGGDLTEADYLTLPDAAGAFEIRGVSPGSYVLLATADGALSSDVIVFNVTDSDIDRVRIALEETMSISGGLSLEGNPRANLSAFRVRLTRSSTEFDQKIDAPASPDGAFTLDRVVPSAEYDIAAAPLPPGTYVKSASSGFGRDLLSGKSRLLPNQRLQIVLAAATDSLDAHVTNGRDPAAGIRVVIIPDLTLRRRADRYITGFTDETGNLRLTAVPPGRYTAYAFEHIEPGAYYALAYNPAADNRFRDRAVSVTVGENGTKAIQLTVIPAAETAGGLQ
jgi:hypothetical protein